MNKTIKTLIIILISFGLYFIFYDILFKDSRKWFFDLTNQLGFSHILSYLITGIPLL